MKNVKSTKRAFLSSVFALFVCLSMLIGTTFAWFTDSVSSGINTIQSGNLDVELEYSSDLISWSKVTSTTNIFKNNILWEPGHTEVVYLRVSNAGSFALKYNLTVNVASEDAGVNKNGETFNLSDYIYYAALEGNFEDYPLTNRITARDLAEQKGAKTVATGSANRETYGKLNKSGDNITYALVVYMPEEIDDEANHNGKDIPQINLGINLYATQETYESDSFGTDYDQWPSYIGVMTQPMVKETTQGNYYEVRAGSDLAWLAHWINTGYDAADGSYLGKYNGFDIKLVSDIDLNGIVWTPIDAFGLNKTFTIDGQGHSISGLNTTTGFIGRNTANITIKNVTFDEATVTAPLSFAGVVIGYQYGKVALENVAVTNSTVKSASYKGIRIGGLVGFSVQNDGATLSLVDCCVTNSTISGYHNVGGLVGSAIDGTLEATGCKVIDNTITYASSRVGAFAYAAGKDGYTAAEVVGKNNTDKNNEIEAPKSINVSNQDDLKAVLLNGGNAVFADDFNVQADNGGYSLSGLTQTNGGTIDGNGNTLTVTKANGTWDCAVYTTGGTIKNLTVNGAFRGIFTAGCNQDIIIDNCIIDNVCYTISSDGSNPNYSIIVTNSTLNGWTSYTSGYKSVSFKDCNFGKGTGGYKYAYCRPYTPTVFTNCSFEKGYILDVDFTAGIVLENCTLDGVKITADNLTDLITEEGTVANVTVK